MNDNEFQNDLKIDPEQLDVEAGMQGELFFKWAQLSIEAREEYDRAKMALEILEAELTAKAKADPERFGIIKTTDLAVSKAVLLQPKWQEANDRLIKARANSYLLEKAVLAMEQRKRMIEILVTLHGQQYFAGPSVPRNLGAAWKDVRNRREESVNEKQGKRARIRRRSL